MLQREDTTRTGRVITVRLQGSYINPKQKIKLNSTTIAGQDNRRQAGTIALDSLHTAEHCLNLIYWVFI